MIEQPQASSPRRIESVAVLGVGTMGQGIAVATALAGIPVTVYDRSAVIDGAMRAIRRRYDAAVAATSGDFGTSVDELVRSIGSPRDAVAGADLVIEAVSEDMAVKQALYTEIGESLRAQTILATNTSSLPIVELAEYAPAPEWFLATHFFNPAELVPGVEVASTEHTHAGVLAETTRFLTCVGKEPINVGAGAGFVANRLQLALFLEAMACVRDGAATEQQVDAVVRRTFGFRLPAYGPFAVADMAGLDVYASILTALENAYGARFEIPQRLRELVAEGRLGVKVRAGFGDFTEAEVAALLDSRDERYRELLAAADAGAE